MDDTMLYNVLVENHACNRVETMMNQTVDMVARLRQDSRYNVLSVTELGITQEELTESVLSFYHGSYIDD